MQNKNLVWVALLLLLAGMAMKAEAQFKICLVEHRQIEEKQLALDACSAQAEQCNSQCQHPAEKCARNCQKKQDKCAMNARLAWEDTYCSSAARR
jgi:hypothetical protein